MESSSCLLRMKQRHFKLGTKNAQPRSDTLGNGDHRRCPPLPGPAGPVCLGHPPSRQGERTTWEIACAIRVCTDRGPSPGGASSQSTECRCGGARRHETDTGRGRGSWAGSDTKVQPPASCCSGHNTHDPLEVPGWVRAYTEGGQSIPPGPPAPSTTGNGRREETGAAKACSTRPWGPHQLLTGQAQGAGPKPQKPAAGGGHMCRRKPWEAPQSELWVWAGEGPASPSPEDSR